MDELSNWLRLTTAPSPKDPANTVSLQQIIDSGLDTPLLELYCKFEQETEAKAASEYAKIRATLADIEKKWAESEDPIRDWSQVFLALTKLSQIHFGWASAAIRRQIWEEGIAWLQTNEAGNGNV